MHSCLVATFERTIENIRRFMQVKRNLKGKTAEVEIKFIIINKNIKDMKNLIELADDLGIKNVCFDDLIPFKEITHLKGKKEKIAREIEVVKKIAEERKIRLVVGFRKGFYAIDQCDWPFHSIFIDVNGNIYPCCNIGVFWAREGSRESVSFGNIFTDDINTIWKGEKYQALRKMIVRNKTPGICQKANCLYVQEN